jgi:hypothetical protein
MHYSEYSALPCLGCEAEDLDEDETTRLLLSVILEVQLLFTPTTFILFFHVGHYPRLASLAHFSM